MRVPLAAVNDRLTDRKKNLLVIRTYIRIYAQRMLKATINASHRWTDVDNSTCPPNFVKTTSNCWTAGFMREAFDLRFTFVRDPVSLFESGVRQAWAMRPSYVGGNRAALFPTADAVLDAQLARYDELRNAAANSSSRMTISSSRPDLLLEAPPPRGNSTAGSAAWSDYTNYGNRGLWLNEHLQPALWRLAGGVTADDVPMTEIVNWVGRTEQMAQLWPEVTGYILESVAAHNGANKAARLHERFIALGHRNSRAGDAAARGTDPSILTADAVRRMCESDLFRAEWHCLGYQLPPECQ